MCRPLELHPHDPPAHGTWPGGRGEDAAHPPRLSEPAGPGRRVALHHPQTAALFPGEQSVLPARHVPRALPQEVSKLRASVGGGELYN